VAAASFRAAHLAERRQKAKNVCAVARRLVSARRHWLNDRLLEAQGASADRADALEREIASLRAGLAALDANGVDGVLAEFGVGDIRQAV
jgi:hypothetical protein